MLSLTVPNLIYSLPWIKLKWNLNQYFKEILNIVRRLLTDIPKYEHETTSSFVVRWPCETWRSKVGRKAKGLLSTRVLWVYLKTFLNKWMIFVTSIMPRSQNGWCYIGVTLKFEFNVYTCSMSNLRRKLPGQIFLICVCYN